jgi:chemotaxis protein CheC
MNIRSLDVAQIDALREVANIGAAHAATALSSMTHTPVDISVPEVRMLRREEAALLLSGDGAFVVVTLDVIGDVTGWMLQVFPEPSAARLVAGLLGRPPLDGASGFRELEQSTVGEVANIMVGASLNALSDFLGLSLSMSPPRFAANAPSDVLPPAAAEADDVVFCMSTRITLGGSSEALVSELLFVPDGVFVGVLLRALRLA